MISRAIRTAAVLLPVLTSVFSAPGAAWAGTITGIRSMGGPGLGGVSTFNVETRNPNDDAGQDKTANIVALSDFFDKSDVIDLTFSVKDSGGRTRYNFQEQVTNKTNDIWKDFHITLGFFGEGTGNAFVPSTLKDGLDFNYKLTDGQEDPKKPKPPAPTSGNMDDPKLNFKKLNRQPNSLAWGQGGQVNPGQTVTFDFVVDIPDLSKEIPKDAQLEKGYLFTLREVPTLDGKITPMPEPSSLILLGTSASCLIGFVWLRHCRTR